MLMIRMGAATPSRVVNFSIGLLEIVVGGRVQIAGLGLPVSSSRIVLPVDGLFRPAPSLR
jgi:hypothetical protein